ncbi:hypothetical protein ACFSJU_08720 [Paradesertivirga mongoliensis]|uniref:Uncharacterized protein n=1 Tax=Paradesertivirga mongoliensis TaxID=2100740 RepID=A0ABW4ZL65_9SPHI|nr:hypothetical protein [Pedobacter mongoliensis]
MTTNFRPPINSRPTEALIGIKYSSTDYWQQEAIDQATIELELRGVTKEEEEKLLDKWQRLVELEEKREQKRLERNEQEGYKKVEMIEIFFTAPLIFLGKWHAGLSLFELRENNFKRKYDQRLYLLIAGTASWMLYIGFSV